MRPFCLLFAAAALLCGDEIRLADGRVIEGEARELGDGQTEIITEQGGMRAVQRVPTTSVVAVVRAPNRQQERYLRLLALRDALAPDAPAEAWWALALQARAAGEQGLGRELAGEAIARDRHHEAARALLGFVRQNGVWLRPSEAGVARGEVFHLGTWMSWSAREALLEEEARRREEARVAAAERARREREEQTAAEPAVIYIQQLPQWNWAWQPPCPRPQPWLGLEAQGRHRSWAWRINWGM
jgi:hypothetical protein